MSVRYVCDACKKQSPLSPIPACTPPKWHVWGDYVFCTWRCLADWALRRASEEES